MHRDLTSAALLPVPPVIHTGKQIVGMVEWVHWFDLSATFRMEVAVVLLQQLQSGSGLLDQCLDGPNTLIDDGME